MCYACCMCRWKWAHFSIYQLVSVCFYVCASTIRHNDEVVLLFRLEPNQRAYTIFHCKRIESLRNGSSYLTILVLIICVCAKYFTPMWETISTFWCRGGGDPTEFNNFFFKSISILGLCSQNCFKRVWACRWRGRKIY